MAKASSHRPKTVRRAHFQPRFLGLGGGPVRALASTAVLALSGVLVCSLPHRAQAAPPIPLPNALPQACAAGACGGNSFVQSGVASTITTANSLTINQASQAAILNWQSFNIGKNATVQFNQPANGAALNRIWDANPSQIYGALKATGQLYLINQNGILFGQGAQVDVGGLVASSLDIKNSRFLQGLLTDTQGNPAFCNDAPCSDGGFGATGNVNGFVVVAQKTSITTADGGSVLLLAPVVENSGTIQTPGGQAILAAGNRVYLQASQDPNLRGILVEVDNDAAASQARDALLYDPNNPTDAGSKAVQHDVNGTVSNLAGGDIEAARGNVTMMGYAVNQAGRVSATTTVDQNGSIKLEARYNVTPVPNNLVSGTSDIRATATGTVTLASGSVTEVLPETSDPTTSTDDQAFNPSRVEIMGQNITLQGGSRITAPGGVVTLAALSSINTTAPLANNANPYQDIYKGNTLSAFLNPGYLPNQGSSANPTQARVYVDSGAAVDVSGTPLVYVPVARNVIPVTLRGTELAGSPMQVNGPLYGQTVYVDIREGAPLANYAAEEAGIARTVAERTSAGGTVNLFSSGDAIVRAGATVNLSGGELVYTPGLVHDPSVLLAQNGQKYNIAQAPASIAYRNVGDSYSVTSNKWGVTQSWYLLSSNSGGHWENGYTEGRPAGTLNVVAPAASVDTGALIARTIPGIYQRQPYAAPPAALGTGLPQYKDSWTHLPEGGTASFGNGQALASNGFTDYGLNQPVLLQGSTPPAPAADAPTLTSSTPLMLDAGALGANGFANLNVYTNQALSMPAGETLDLGPGGMANLTAGRMDIAGRFVLPGGNVHLATAVTATYPTGGALNFSGDVAAQGLWVNDLLTQRSGGIPTSPVVLNGGQVSFVSSGTLDVTDQARVDVSGGAWLTGTNKLTGGRGGSIKLVTADNLYYPSLTLGAGATLFGYGVTGSSAPGTGGSLSLTSDNLLLGSGTGPFGTSPDFFTRGGFTNYSLTDASAGGTSLVLNQDLTPRADVLQVDPSTARAVPGGDIAAVGQPVTLPDYMRAPANLSIASKNGSIEVAPETTLSVDVGGKISLSAKNQLRIFGTLDAPAGQIKLTLLTTANDSYNPAAYIWLGGQSQLLSRGALVSQPNDAGLALGQLKAGGSVQLDGGFGAIVGQAGSLIDVSGTSAALDVPAPTGLGLQHTDVASNAGSVSANATEGVFIDSTLAGQPGGAGAAGGSFSLAMNRGVGFSYSDSPSFPNAPREIHAQDGGGSVPAGLNAGQPLPSASDGQGYVSANMLRAGGFDEVSLASQDRIDLANATPLQTRRSVSLQAPVIDVAGNAAIESGYVSLGNNDPLNQPAIAPQLGNGQLDVYAGLIDLWGTFGLSGVVQTNLYADGDIRLNGVLDQNAGPNALSTASPGIYVSYVGALTTTGSLDLSAAQIYPTTLSQYRLAVQDGAGQPAGHIGFHAAGAATPVLSAGGRLQVSAAQIEQAGVVKAPLGSVELDAAQGLDLAPGSLTSVSGENQTIPFGSFTSNTWTYNGGIVSTDNLPQKSVVLRSNRLNLQSGATADISGGGELYAYEYVAGPPGSQDVLAGNSYALLPGLNSRYAPYDPQYSASAASQVGASVYLAGGAGIAPGYYTLLPARYALLPGAYLITPAAGYANLQPGLSVAQPDGTAIIAGKNASVVATPQGAGGQMNFGYTADALWAGFHVAPGSWARGQSSYVDHYAGATFAAAAQAAGTAAPRLPMDAGQLVFAATGSGANMDLKGNVLAASAQGSGGAVDIDSAGQNIRIVSAPDAADTTSLQLSAADLNRWGAESLLIGGQRSFSPAGVTLSVDTANVTVDNAGTPLVAPELLLAAQQDVTIDGGATVQGQGTPHANPAAINVSGDGALLRVSGGGLAPVLRSGVAGNSGRVILAAGANVLADNAVTLDSSLDPVIDDSAVLQGKALSLGASRVSLGDTGGAAVSGLLLGDKLLARLQQFSQLDLTSYSTLDFYGASGLGLATPIANLDLRAQAIRGFSDAQVTINAQSFAFSNTGGANTEAYQGSGGGTLTVNSQTINLGAGDKAIQGFATTTLNADQEITGQGTGSLAIDGDTHLNGTRLTLHAKAAQTISASGDMTLTSLPAQPATADSLAASLTLQGRSIAQNGLIDLPTGSVTLKATGADANGNGIVLGTGSAIHAGALAQTLGGSTSYAPGGEVTLQADNGNIVAQAGAAVDVAAPQGGDAGSLTVSAAQGNVSLAQADLRGGAASGRQGSFSLDAGTVEARAGQTDNDFSKLNSVLENGGFGESRSIDVHRGDLTVAAADTVTAHNISIAADGEDGAGNLNVFGTLDASGRTAGEAGGQIRLYAARNVNLTQAGVKAMGAQGGRVEIGTTTGAINFDNASRIDVTGQTQGGTVLLRIPRAGYPNNLSVASQNIVGARDAAVEAFKTYDASATGTADSVIAQAEADAAQFMQGAAPLPIGLQLRPGVELDSNGNLGLNNSLNLYNWSGGATAAPLILTLRAQGDLNIFTQAPATTAQSLSDGFDSAGKLAGGASASYRLVAGADVGSADPLATVAGSGSFTLGAGSAKTTGFGGASSVTYAFKQIRTGTGNIDIAAGSDVVFGNQQSVVYTAGVPDSASPAAAPQNTGLTPGYFPGGGGDVSVTADGNVNSASAPNATNQFVTEWLQRGSLQNSDGSLSSPAAWWVNYGAFSQNLGAIGGGAVKVDAGGDVSNLSASVASAGYYDPIAGNNVNFGGGDLTVAAGGNINSGQFYVGLGQGRLQAGGSLGASLTSAGTGAPIYTLLGLGQGGWDVATHGDLGLLGVVNPTVLGQGASQKLGFTKPKTYFFTYGDQGQVNLASVAGSITLDGDVNKLVARLPLVANSNIAHPELAVWPATLNATAYAGDVQVSNPITLYPSGTGNLALQAGGNVVMNGTITMSDASPSRLNSAAPQGSYNGSGTSAGLGAQLYATDLVHLGDATPVSVAANGSIMGPTTSQDSFILPKAAHFDAGQDILYLSFVVQNLSPDDVTSLAAGRDIVMTPSGSANDSTNRILLHGPGQLVLQAGRNVDLGTAQGVVTDGSISNPLLPSGQGAAVTVLAGLGGNAPDYQDFAAQYVAWYLDYYKQQADQNPDDAGAQAAYLTAQQAVSGFDTSYQSYEGSFVVPTGATAAEAKTAFNLSLPYDLRSFLDKVFYLRLTAAAAEGSAGQGYNNGYDATASLFPDSGYRGDLTMYYSQIKTLRGGDIDLLVPGGMINAGLSNPAVSKDKLANLGIVTAGGGDINAFLKGDFLVNQSRVFTLLGGNILIWSSDGSIDAGRGAKSASVTPPPVLTFDPKTGRFTLDTTASVTGSGIRTLQAAKDVAAGTVTLAAPHGVVNAADAGIGAAGNVLIAAAVVKGGENISSGGTTTGVQASTAGSTAGALTSAGSAGSDVAKATQDLVSSLTQTPPSSSFLPTMLDVEVLGFGGQ